MNWNHQTIERHFLSLLFLTNDVIQFFRDHSHHEKEQASTGEGESEASTGEGDQVGVLRSKEKVSNLGCCVVGCDRILKKEAVDAGE